MKQYSFDYNGYNFVRVSKKTAKRFFESSYPVVFCPCNLCPFGVFGSAVTLKKSDDNADFIKAVNAFEFYNIRNAETGYYTAFYIPAVYVDKKTGEKDPHGFYYGHDNSKNKLAYDNSYIF